LGEKLQYSVANANEKLSNPLLCCHWVGTPWAVGTNCTAQLLFTATAVLAAAAASFSTQLLVYLHQLV
jgi:hypothetical protein